ncbi:MAG: metallophosphoesterase [Gemmatimonadales bacterium]
MPTLWATDIHLDHASPAAVDGFLGDLREMRGDALILTGDISLSSRFADDLIAIADAAGCPVYYLLGNHDHYGASVGEVRDRATALAAKRPDILWLPPAGVVTLGPGAALVGVDGWADGRFGDPLTTPLLLNDDKLIAELAAQESRRGKLFVKRMLADADASRLGILLHRAADLSRSIIVATHVPPFTEALPTRGRLASSAWLPLLVCGATGQVLTRFATEHPDHDLTVLAGHTHVAQEVDIAPNLHVRIGGARYGAPRIGPL